MGLLLFISLPLAADEASSAPDLKEIEAELSSGRAGSALQKVRLALEYQPNRFELLEAASRSAEKAEDPDLAMWYGRMALDSLGDSRTEKRTAHKLRTRLAKMDPHSGKGERLLEEYLTKVFGLAEYSRRSKLYVNAVDLYFRCRGTSYATKADVQLQKIFNDEASVLELLRSGIDVPFRAPRSRLSEKKTAARDRAHKSWENPEEIETENYRVVTNVGYEKTRSVALAMEQMNRFYRKIFPIQADLPTCRIEIYSSHQEFMERENLVTKDMHGFFQTGVNRVVTYDPSSSGRPFSRLWSTLFHEASHQFTSVIPVQVIPSWLNEGTASYFEGVRLSAGGAVQANLIPEQRIVELRSVLDEGRLGLKDLLSYGKPGSYPADYYSLGWSLVYFLHNFEDDRSERIYLPAYRKIFEHYWKDQDGSRPLETFVRFFISNMPDAGIENFDGFNDRYTAWIKDLLALESASEENVARLLRRARKQRSDGKFDAARESYQGVIRRDPDHIRAHFELGESLAELRNKDGAIYSLRKALFLVRRREDPTSPVPGFDELDSEEVLSRCLELILKLNRPAGKNLSRNETAFVSDLIDVCKDYANIGFPLFALSLARQGSSALGGDLRLAALQREVRESSGVEDRRWRRIQFEPDLSGFQGVQSMERLSSEMISLAPARMEIPLRVETPPERYRFEALLSIDEKRPGSVFGLAFGVNPETGIRYVGFFENGSVVTGVLGSEEIKPVVIHTLKKKPLAEMLLSVEVDGETARFFLDDEDVGSAAVPPEALLGSVGLMVQNARARFSNLRLLY